MLVFDNVIAEVAGLKVLFLLGIQKCIKNFFENGLTTYSIVTIKTTCCSTSLIKVTDRPVNLHLFLIHYLQAFLTHRKYV